MSGKIEYELGLETGSFAGKLVGVNAGVQLITFAMNKLGQAGTLAWAQIDRGAKFQDLSNRTGESVKDLTQLSHALEMSGVSAGGLPVLLQRYRSSLGGVGEMGENTAEAFRLLGLNIADLGRLDAPEALTKIFSGLNKLDRNSAAGVAGKIFGRGSAGDILQLARDSEDFAENLAEASRQAEIMGQNAAAFDRIGDSLGKIRLKSEGMFLDMAVKIAPIVQGIFDTILNPGDLFDVGERLELALTVGFGNAVNFFSHSLQRVFAALLNLVLGSTLLVIPAMLKMLKGPLGAFVAPFMPAGTMAALQAADAAGVGVDALSKPLAQMGKDQIRAASVRA